MRRNSQKGFTLIELLVVIAIIGILATIVLTSLGSATKKANDAKISGQVSSMRAQAQLYTGAVLATSASLIAPCTITNNGTTLFDTTLNGLGSLLTGAMGNGTGECASTATLPSAGGAWAVALPLYSGAYACADSTGISRTTLATNLVAGAANGTGAAVNLTTDACTAL